MVVVSTSEGELGKYVSTPESREYNLDFVICVPLRRTIESAVLPTFWNNLDLYYANLRIIKLYSAEDRSDIR